MPTTSGDVWNVNDAAIPGLDTGSIRTTSLALQGYGGIRMSVAGSTDRLDGILLRGFGLKYDGATGFESQHAVELEGVAVKRSLLLNQANSWGRFFDTFTNTTKTTLTVDVAFGGQLGYNTITGNGSNQSAVATTSSGDNTITSADSWASFYSPSAGAGSASINGPSATTVGTAGYVGALTKMGNFLRNPFINALATSGDEANHYGFVNRIIIPPGQTRSVAHFVVTGLSESRATGGVTPAAGSQVSAVQNTAASLSSNPAFADLSTAAICTLTNYNLATLSVPGFSAANCPATQGEPLAGAVQGAVKPAAQLTTSPYDVVGKTITQELADMRSGKTTAQQITQAYLDRIAAYDQGPLGLHSVLTVAPDAMDQAKAADAARAAGDTRPLLGIPILAKDIYDTKDMPTTGGSLVFDGYRPTKDAWLVAKLRKAGAIILGKANLSEFATSGHYSQSAYGQVWNAFDNSKSSIGSSGGSAVALASSFAAASLGTQTGDSLWGPAGAASLFSLRGTDGMQSTGGVMPLTYIQDYAGVFTRSAADLALMMNATAIDNPNDPLDDVANGHRPADWGSTLRTDALQGKVIGAPLSAFLDPFGTTGTSDAMRAQFQHFIEAGATVKPITDPPAAPTNTSGGDRGYEGWRQWILDHPDNPYTDVTQITRSAKRLPQFRNTTTYTGAGAMTAADVKAFQDFRANYRALLGSWMDAQGVDAVVFPTELSDIHLNDSIDPSFGRLDPQSSAAGVPTVILPAGVNDHGQPIGLQLEGRAFSDDTLLGYAYAFEAKADGHVDPTSTPALTYDPEAVIAPITPMTPLPGQTTTASPRLTVPSQRNFVTARGKAKVQVGCASTTSSCTGTVTVSLRGKRLTTSTVSVAPGQLRTVAVKLNRSTKARLGRGKAVRLAITVTGTGTTASTPSTATVKVRRR